jgi:O-methyltransferase involved in polyketide biosynthesis
MLKKAGVHATGVIYVPADFLEKDWFDKLEDAGFEPNSPSSSFGSL